MWDKNWKYKLLLNIILDISCNDLVCKNSICVTDFETPTCKCLAEYIGSECETKITTDNVLKLLDNLSKMISSINSYSELSNKDINSIDSYQNLLDMFPNIIPEELSIQMSKLAEDQIALIQNGNIKPNPNLLNILDLSLQFTL